MKTRFRTLVIAILCLAVNGCVAYAPGPVAMPVGPAYAAPYSPYGYPAYSHPAYGYPAYGYAPGYYGPAVGFGFFPRFHGWGHHH